MLRPSGVSSASDASCAASASSFLARRRARRGSADAWRLPSVIVPVLSSSSTSTSPAASTARPDVAITFACIMRPMPATPIADSRPPIVVGIRQTSSATSTVIVTGACRALRGVDAEDRERQQRRRSRAGTRCVSATSRIVSAISFGVFCRFAPSTIAIIRSRKLSPGLARDAHDEPVGQHARAAGDRREVAAGLADHRRRFAGDRALVDRRDAFDRPRRRPARSSPASTRYDVALAQLAFAGTTLHRRVAPRLRAASSRRRLCFTPRSDAACALLRPSASASAKFANSTREPQPDARSRG